MLKKQKNCVYFSVNDTTMYYLDDREHALSIKTTIMFYDFQDPCLPKHQTLYISFNLQLRRIQNIYHLDTEEHIKPPYFNISL